MIDSKTLSLVLTRGLPASGKTTWAKEWVMQAPVERARVCRDDLRQLLYGMDAPLPRELEEGITIAERASVRALLRSGRSVVVDAMHLRRSYITEWEKIAQETGADFSVEERFLDVKLDELILRDQIRSENDERHVGEQFIRETSLRYATIEPYKPSPETDGEMYIYVPENGLPTAWLVDIDGTLAIKGDRSPYDWHRVGEDTINGSVVDLVEMLRREHRIILVSGRDSVCRRETEEWLIDKGIIWHELLMRPEGDMRKDAIVKLEMFREQIAPRHNVLGVLDDRPSVCRAWRRVGLFVAQVGDPHIEF